MGRMYNYVPIVYIYVTVLKLSGRAPVPDGTAGQVTGIRMMVRLSTDSIFRFHRAPRGRAPPHKTARIGVLSETRRLALSLEGTRRTHSRSHKSRMTT